MTTQMKYRIVEVIDGREGIVARTAEQSVAETFATAHAQAYGFDARVYANNGTLVFETNRGGR